MTNAKVEVMARILAIEADPRRKRLLAGLVREFVKAELKIAANTRSAIAIIDERIPDLILTPTLLSSHDGEELMACVRRHDAPYVQSLTIPAFDLLADAPEEDKRRFLGSLFTARSAPRAPLYDRAMVGGQIADALAQALAARRDHEEVVACRDELARTLAEQRELALLRPFDGAAARHAGVDRLVIEPRTVSSVPSDDRRAALRRTQHDLPWISGISLGWDAGVALVNISTSGVLMETGSKFLPGSMTELRLRGPETDIIVPVLFVRSEVARVDRLGARYHTAATFVRAIDLKDPRGAASLSQTRALADLLASALAARDRRPEPAHVTFVRGVRDLIDAREVQLRTAVPGSVADRDGLSFDVPGDDRFRRTLHVVFDHHRPARPEELKLLRAAALLTAAAIELESPSPDAGPETIDGRKLLAECVA